jgi:hypothetical protein
MEGRKFLSRGSVLRAGVRFLCMGLFSRFCPGPGVHRRKARYALPFLMPTLLFVSRVSAGEQCRDGVDAITSGPDYPLTGTNR